MRFLDNNYLKVVNLEGIEKIIDIQNNFTTIAFHKIPYFDIYDLKEGFEKNPYYFEREAYEMFDTEKWMARKQQRYRSHYHLQKNKCYDFEGLYEVMFNVERKFIGYANLSFSYLHWSLMY